MTRTSAPAKLQQLGDSTLGTFQAMAAGFVSPVIDTQSMDAVSWEGLYTGTPAGVFTIEASNQYDPVRNPTPTFITMPATTPAFPVPAGAGGAFLVTSPGLGGGAGAGRYQRLRYAPSAGAGNFSLWVAGTAK